jgi:antitoxin YefM
MYVCAYMFLMRAISATQLRRTLAATLDQVADDHEPVIVTREGGKPAAIILSLEDFGSYEETDYLLRSPENKKRLLEAIAELDSGGGTERELLE